MRRKKKSNLTANMPITRSNRCKQMNSNWVFVIEILGCEINIKISFYLIRFFCHVINLVSCNHAMNLTL